MSLEDGMGEPALHDSMQKHPPVGGGGPGCLRTPAAPSLPTISPPGPASGPDLVVEPERAALVALNAQLTQQLARSEQLAGLGRIAGGIAHELNNPLAALLGTLDLMKELTSAEEGSSVERLSALHALLVDCGAIVDRMKDLVTAVKGMGREGGQTPVMFDPGRAVRDAVKVFAVAHRRRCQVALSLPALPAVFGSPSRLGQVILNLLQNGLDASATDSPELVRLEVVAAQSGEQIELQVIDHGGGIPDGIAPFIFEPFFTSKPPEKGTGLGLYLCREIVGEMKGTIRFDSTPRGTTFRVVLPIYRPDDGD